MKLRLPEEMRDRIAELAKKNGRSMNAEILQRLEWGLAMDREPEIHPPTPEPPPGGSDLTYHILEEIKQFANEKQIPFDEALSKIFIAGLHPNAAEIFYVLLTPGTTKEDMRAALEVSDLYTKQDATLIIERVDRAPWTPDWLRERLQTLEKGSPETNDPSPKG